MDLRTLAADIANSSGFLDLYAFCRRKITGSQVAILNYHSVLPRDHYWYSGPGPENFKRQISYFSSHFEILSLNKLADYLKKKRSLPAKALAITFDDGYKDNYIYAYPVLKKFHVPATIFLATGYIESGRLFWWNQVKYLIDKSTLDHISLPHIGVYRFTTSAKKWNSISKIIDRLKELPEEEKNRVIATLASITGVSIPPELSKGLILSWEEIREMHSDGINFGAHSVSHPILTRITPAQAQYEISQSKRDIEDKLKAPVTDFSYPNGDFNDELIALVKKNGFSCSVSVSPSTLINRNDDIFTLSRIGATDDFNKFKAEFCGLWGDSQRRK